MPKLRFGALFLILLLFVVSSSYGAAKVDQIQDSVRYVSPFAEDNENCFKCHAQKKFEYTDELSGEQRKSRLLSGMIHNRQQFYESNHKSFSCNDCHSRDFNMYPHPEEVKSELHFHCLDCHGGDPAYSKFKFEEIDAEYRKSVHYKLEEEGFSCWKCHDPHSYRLMARNSKNIQETVAYDNNICLDCHTDIKKKHKWLPHRDTHFANVRCIECHAYNNDNLLVSHLILSDNEPVRDCGKCHSDNPVAMASILMLRSGDDDFKNFNNDALISALNIVGKERSSIINNLTLILFISITGIIGVHILFRVIRK